MNAENKKVVAFLLKAKVSTGLNKLAVENIKEFKLDPDGRKGERFLGEMMADSNLGGNGDGRMLRNSYQDGCDPESEITAWRAQFQVAEDLCGRHGFEPTNLNLMLLSHHPKATKAWEKCCK